MTGTERTRRRVPEDVVARLKAIVGPAGTVEDPEDIAPYCVAWRDGWHGRVPVVLRPASTEEVSAIVAICAETRTPIVPQGGNTGLTGASQPHDDMSEVIVSTARMRAVRSLDLLNDTITVEAGVVLAEIQERAKAAERLFPLSLGAEGSAQIGGNLSTNAGGTQVLRYGNARNLVLGLEVVLPDGRVWNGLRGLRKDNTGYDMKQLFIGAEGTLGIVTGATVELRRQEETGPTAFVAVRTVEDAVALFSALEAGGGLDACELISQAGMSRLAGMPGAPPLPLGMDHPWYVLVEWAGTTTDGAGLLEPAEALIVDGVMAASEQQRNDLWRIREMHGAACRRAGHPRQHDVAVPRSAIAAFMAEATNVARQRAPAWQPVPIAHIGDGNVHFDLVPRDAGSSPAFDCELSASIHDLAHRCGGVFSAEHGIGAARANELHRLMPHGNAQALAAIRQALDPHGLMNPGKVIAPLA